MNRARWIPAGMLAALLCTACGEREGEGDDVRTAANTEAEAAPGAAVVAGDSVFDPDEQRAALPSVRIYHTLTDHEWYARGEPLQHEGVPYAPAGAPVAASAEEMEHVGEYQGVEYYARPAEPDPIVYVPVFHGYWQPFRADSTAQRAGD